MVRQKKNGFGGWGRFVIPVLLGAFIGLMLFIGFALHGVYEQYQAYDACEENENLSDTLLWAYYPECMYSRLEKNPGIEIRINISEVG